MSAEYVLVPFEPTDEMIAVGVDELNSHLGPGSVIDRDPLFCWRAMVRAAPRPTPPSDWNEAVKACLAVAEVWVSQHDEHPAARNIVASIRTLTRPDPILATDAQSSGSADREDAEAAGSGPSVEPPSMTLLRGSLSKRATSAEFNEWQAREVVEYVDSLIRELRAPTPASGQDGERVSEDDLPDADYRSGSAIAADVMSHDLMRHLLNDQQASAVYGRVQEAVIRELRQRRADAEPVTARAIIHELAASIRDRLSAEEGSANWSDAQRIVELSRPNGRAEANNGETTAALAAKGR